MLNTAERYSALGRHAEARDLEEQGLAMLRRVLPADHSNIAKFTTAMMNSGFKVWKFSISRRWNFLSLQSSQFWMMIGGIFLAGAAVVAARSTIGRKGSSFQYQ